MDDFSVTLVWLGFFASIFFGWYYYIQARNKERMALIDKNADVSEIFRVRRHTFRFPWLRLGMIFLGVGLGLLMALFVSNKTSIRDGEGDTIGVLVIGFMMLFGGIGAVVSHFIDKPKEN